MSSTNKYASLKALKLPAMFAAPGLVVGAQFVGAFLTQPNGLSSAAFFGGMSLCASTLLGAVGYCARPEKNNHIKEASKHENI